MESPVALGGAEEHSGSESGWTIYIGSTIPNENDNKGRDIHGENAAAAADDDDDDGGSEDSMASDASSGPSHHDQLPCGKGEGSGNTGHIMKHAKDEGNSKYYSSEKKPHKQVKKKDEGRVKEEKGQSVYRAESAASQVSISGAKQRKTKMMLKQD
ncbi:hypothetical protein FH972_008825 [Carpinus fangiana]|uniref:Uncharacterized protein n=1 Tax=Carpinus fangiana TaxID=176857 RepID=A0A5N6R2N4_9ROSI|nr:hypothetical protein FH972_008825 [Carpinus fangiana]